MLETTGFSELFHVTKALRRVSVEGCPIVGKGGQGTVYRLGDETIVKVYKPETSLADINHER